jgi:formamidopyrimidine-DNA glycosylase
MTTSLKQRVFTEVRCPDCGKKYAEHLEGRMVFFCRKCQESKEVDNRAILKE